MIRLSDLRLLALTKPRITVLIFLALKAALDQEGKVIVSDCLLNILYFLPLISSHFLPVREVGWMMGVMLIACAIGTLFFMASLLPHCVTARKVLA